MAVFFSKKEARRVDSISSRGLLNQSSGSAEKPGLAVHNGQRAVLEPPNMVQWHERLPVKSVQSSGASIYNAPWAKIPFNFKGIFDQCA